MANLEPFAPLPSQDEKHQLAVVLTAMGTGFDKQQRGCETSVVARWLGQLTLEEKVDLLSGSDFCSTAGNSRLHIPSLKIVDSIAGVKGADLVNGTSTLCFPSTACMGSTWNRELLFEVGAKLALQAKSKSAQVILGPVLNLHRDPRGGRNFESFGEDPLLAGELGAALTNGIQSNGIAACPKHFIGNECETKRREQNVAESINGRSMREIYLASYQTLFRNSNPMAIMMAYNKVDGVFCSEHTSLIQNILREEWGYRGCSISDWYGTHSCIPAIMAGLDLEMPGPSVFRGAKLVEAVKNGRLNQTVLDDRVANVLKLVEQTKSSHSTAPEESLFDESANQLAKQVGMEGIILLQNRNSILPLVGSERLAIIGAAATAPPISGGGSAAAPPQYVKCPADFIKALHSQPDFVETSAGVMVHVTIPTVSQELIFAHDGKNGVDVRYFNDGDITPVLEESQPLPEVVMLGQIKPGLKADAFSYEITTTLIPRTTGLHTIGIQATGSFVLKINGENILSEEVENVSIEDFLFQPQHLEILCKIEMKSSTPYFLDLRVRPHKTPNPTSGEPHVHAAKLCFLEQYSDEQEIAAAVAVAQNADTSIIFAGRSAEYESEGYDMLHIKLPINQVEMIKAVAATSQRSVLILHCANPIDVQDFVDDVDAIICAHFLGQEGGSALADILYGNSCPSGKLAVTWPKCLEDAPSFPYYPAKKTNRGWEISCGEGLGVGYRHDWTTNPSQWPFGFGLSYTTFRISSLSVSRVSANCQGGEAQLNIKALLTNTGLVAGAEVVQMYVEDVVSSVSRPVRELKGFTKVFLEPQTSEVIEISCKERHAFSFWNEQTLTWTAEAGEFRIHVGDCVASIHLSETLSWRGL